MNDCHEQAPSVIERFLPEQHLYLKSCGATRFIRLRPTTQMLLFGGVGLILAWVIVATTVVVIDKIELGSAELQRSDVAFEYQINSLADERDSRAVEAKTAHARFASALEQVSAMQSKLLEGQQRERELELTVSLLQEDLASSSLPTALAPPLASDAQADHADGAVAVELLADSLTDAARLSYDAERRLDLATREADRIAADRDRLMARNDEIFTQLEAAVDISLVPLADIFENVGMDPESVLETVREGYSGEGGPLEPFEASPSDDPSISEVEARANKVLISLDQLNTYRIAMDKLPLAMPVRKNFRYSSFFGRRWGRSHKGVDMAAPIGTPIHVTADGTVTFSGWQSGYGNIVIVSHELGMETRYGHMSRLRVKVGERVSQGDRIGDMGNTGRSTGSHLHYEVRTDGRATNPMTFIKAAQNVQ